LRPVAASPVWHEVECGGYSADLALWEQLAADAGGPVLELGCGTGRVALHIAQRGHSVCGLDDDRALLRELERRAAERGLEVEVEQADAAEFELGRRFGLVLAPMQLIQLLPAPSGRASCLRSISAHLRPGGLAAIAIVETGETQVPPTPPLPDVRELEGWVYSSLPLAARREGDVLVVERLRQAVSPQGRLEESRGTARLQLIGAAELEAEARRAGLQPRGRRAIAAGDHHVGSTVVLLGSPE
jgi:SAM-dependent methyltransferase